MTVQVKIPTILRTYTGGEKSVPGDGANLAALLDDLESRHAGLKGRLITEDGALHRFVNVYVNDEDVRFTGSLETALSDGDAVTILPAVAGGSPEFEVAGGSPEFEVAGGSPEFEVAGGSPEFEVAGS